MFSRDTGARPGTGCQSDRENIQSSAKQTLRPTQQGPGALGPACAYRCVAPPSQPGMAAGQDDNGDWLGRKLAHLLTGHNGGSLPLSAHLQQGHQGLASHRPAAKQPQPQHLRKSGSEDLQAASTCSATGTKAFKLKI